MITLFAVPKAFRGHVGLIQRNALATWKQLDPECQVLLFGNERGVAEAAEEFGFEWIRHVRTNEFGTPYLDDVFDKATRQAAHRLIGYVNADIVLLPDFLDAVRRIDLRWFVLAGQRWDLDVAQPLEVTSADWWTRLRYRARRHGVLHPPGGSDFFVFPRELPLGDFPPFVVGRPGWDNWFIFNARRRGIPVVDITRVTVVVHQNHDYVHVPQGRDRTYWGPEGDYNASLLGGSDRRFTLLDASHRLTRHGIRRVRSVRRALRRLGGRVSRLPFLGPLVGPLKSAVATVQKKRSPRRNVS